MLALFMGLSLVWRIGVIVALISAVVGVGWYVHHTLYHWGYDAAKNEDKPIIAKATLERDNAIKDIETAQRINREFQAELTRLDALTREQQASIDTYKAKALEAEIKVRKALLDIAVKEKKYTAEIARLVAIAAGPPITEGACDEADAILRELARDRMRNAGATASTSDATTKGGARRSGGNQVVH